MAGSISSLIQSIRRLDEYEAWKRAVLVRDRFTCQQCGKRNGRQRIIEAHHVQSLAFLVRRYGLDSLEAAQACPALWDTANGQTLCKACHQSTDSYPKQFRSNGKKNRNRTNHKATDS